MPLKQQQNNRKQSLIWTSDNHTKVSTIRECYYTDSWAPSPQGPIWEGVDGT